MRHKQNSGHCKKTIQVIGVETIQFSNFEIIFKLNPRGTNPISAPSATNLYPGLIPGINLFHDIWICLC